MKINGMIQRPVFVIKDRNTAEKLMVHKEISYTVFRCHILVVLRLINIFKRVLSCTAQFCCA
jgi:hypothetical protein